MSLVISMHIDIDCENISCLTFTDITKAYNASTNPLGYGGPNTPAIEDIDSVVFSLTINDVVYEYSNSEYKPTANGTNSICLKATDFISGSNTLTEFTKGATYSIGYVVNITDNSNSVSAEPQSFVFPCCGATIPSSLGVSFTITEKLGCSSIDFKDTTEYGGSNPDYSDIESTIIRITLADGTVKDIADFKPTVNNQIKNIGAHELGYDGPILPQVVIVEYYIYKTGDCRIGYKSTKVLLHCALRNCIVSKGKSTLVTNCGACSDGEVNVTISLIMRYEMLLLASYDNIDCIAKEVEELYEECQKYCGCS